MLRAFVFSWLAYVLVATFPFVAGHMAPGLDASWIYALNRLPSTGLSFGPDVAFTYGPLGYFLWAIDLSPNPAAASVLRLATQALLGLLVVVMSGGGRRAIAAIGFLIAWWLARPLGLTYEYSLLLTLAVVLAALTSSWGVWFVVLGATAAALAAFLLYARPALGLGALLMVAIAGVWLARLPSRRPRDVALVLVVPLTVAIVGFGALALRGLAAFGLWLSRSLDIIRGFPVALSQTRPAAIVWLGAAAAFASILSLMALVRRDGPASWIVAGPLAVVVLLAFRHSFVRHGWAIFGVALATCGVVLLWSRTRLGQTTAAVAGASVVLIFAIAIQAGVCACGWGWGGLGPGGGWEHLRSAIAPDRFAADLHARTSVALAADRLPDRWVSLMRGARNGVDTVPTQIEFVPANDLPWNPSPVLQTYQAYMQGLDAWVARHFRAGGAPDFIILNFFDVDGRHPMHGAPRMWRAIVEGYEPAFEETSLGPYGEVALLRRRAAPLSIDPRPVVHATVPTRTWVTVPRDQDMLFASLRFDLTSLGLLAAGLWKIEPVYADLERTDGSRITVRVLPSTSAGGLLLAPLPVTMGEFLGFLRGKRCPGVRRFRLHGPGLSSFQPRVRLTWLSSEWPFVGLGD